MELYEDRITSLSQMFMDSLEQLQQSRTLAQMNSVELIKYRIQYIGQILKANIFNEKQKYILELMQQIQDLKHNNHAFSSLELEVKEKQIEALKKMLEEKQTKPQTIDSQLKGLIQKKMQQLENDYILKVIHDQQIKSLEKKYASNYNNENNKIIEQITQENQLLKDQIQRLLRKQEIRLIEIERGSSPVRELDGICSQFYSVPQTKTKIQIPKQIQPLQSISHLPFVQVQQMSLRRSKSIETFDQLKDNFQKELNQLRSTLKSKNLKIKQKQKQILNHNYGYSSYNFIQVPLRSEEHLIANKINVPHLDYYTFGRCNVSSPVLKKTKRGSQRVFNARRGANIVQPEQYNILSLSGRYLK